MEYAFRAGNEVGSGQSAMERYTCNEYRQEMVLLGLRRRLQDPEIDETERHEIEEQIRLLEKEMGIR